MLSTPVFPAPVPVLATVRTFGQLLLLTIAAARMFGLPASFGIVKESMGYPSAVQKLSRDQDLLGVGSVLIE